MVGRLLLLGVLAATLVLGVGLAGASTAEYGYAAYSINYVWGGVSHSVLVNESVASTPNPNLSLLTFTLRGSGWNLTYSTDINSSLPVFPYVPSLTNKSFTYQTPKYSFEFTLTEMGKTTINYGGNTYTGTLYAFSGVATYNGTSYKASGNLTVFPTGLLYSFTAQLDTNGSVTVQLVSTNLPLQSSDPHSEYVVVGVTAGVGGAAVAILGLGLPFTKRSKGQAQLGGRRDYWVD